MKKIMALLFCAYALTASAFFENGELLGSPVLLHCEAIRVGSAGTWHPKSPIDIPEASLEDHTLYIGTAFSDDVTVQLVTVDDVTGVDTVEYSTVLYAGDQTVVFPSTLSGTYELRIIVDWYYLAGEVEL